MKLPYQFESGVIKRNYRRTHATVISKLNHRIIMNESDVSLAPIKKPVKKSVNFKHGFSTGRISEYSTWVSMKQRCLNPNAFYYKAYGGRGIKVCERWRLSFPNFLKDMGFKPSIDHSIERKNTNGNYEPSNCVWATNAEQQENRRNINRIEYKGRKISHGEISRKLGCGITLIAYRIKKGWSAERIINTPPNPSKQRFKHD